MEQGNPNPLKILIIAKYDPTFDWVHLSLQEQNYNVVGRVDTVAEAAKRVQRTHIDIVLADTSAVGTADTS